MLSNMAVMYIQNTWKMLHFLISGTIKTYFLKNIIHYVNSHNINAINS